MDRVTRLPNFEHEYDYWCHYCNQLVHPRFIGSDAISCPRCHRGFVEQIQRRTQGSASFPVAANAVVHEQGERVMFDHRSPTFGFVVTMNFSLPLFFGGIGHDFTAPGIQNTENEVQRSGNGTPPASTASIQAMPFVTVSREHLPLHCPICLDDFQVGEVTRQMPCKHTYHSHCILKWLESNSSCPICRFQMPVRGHDEQRPQQGESTSGDQNRSSWFPFTVSWALRNVFGLLRGRPETRGQGPPSRPAA